MCRKANQNEKLATIALDWGSMKKLFTLVLVLMVAGCTDFQQSQTQELAQARERFALKSDFINSKVTAGVITRSEGANEMARTAREIFPRAYKFHALMDYQALLLFRVDKGDMPIEEAKYLYSRQAAEYEADEQAYTQQIQAQNEAIQRAVIAGALINMGNTFRQISVPPPRPLNCHTTPFGNEYATSCY